MDQLHPLTAVTAEDPYPYYARLIADRPFFRDEKCGMWVAASAEAVESVLSSAVMRVRPLSQAIPPTIVGTAQAGIFERLVRMTDGPSQVVLKDAVHATLDPLNLSELATTTERCAKLLIENLSSNDGVDLNTYIFGLPALVIAATLGFSEDDAARAVAWTRLLVRSLAPGGTADEVACGSSPAIALQQAMVSLTAVAPGDDSLFSAFVAAGRRRGIDDTVIVANAVGFLLQSYDASAGLIGNALRALATAPPDLRDSVVDDPDLLERVVAETVRYDSPIQNTSRFVAGDATVLGSGLREGDTVLVLLAAANRDPTANADPHRFDLARTNRSTYTFGIGAHACPGARIATTIVRAGVAYLLRSNIDLQALHSTGYYPSLNARIPHFETAQRGVVR